MRIAITADPYIPVPPVLYGGTERIIAFVVRGLHARGHHVTLVAHPRSTVECAELVPYGCPPHAGLVPRVRELVAVQRALCRRVGELDIVHSWGRLAGLSPLFAVRSLPKIQSYGRALHWPGIRRACRLAGGSLVFTACSSSVYQRRALQGKSGGVWHTIFNGVDLEPYDPVPNVGHDAPLVFLSQLEPMKGPHVAIAIARAAKRRLIIAGNVQATPAGQRYFDTRIAPALGSDVEYVGAVDDRQKNELLGRAAALVFPTFYDEAFGIVMAEAMACGTPVIGFANGAVPEVIRHGVTGFVCHNEKEAVAAVERLSEIDRTAVRRDCEARFSSTVIVDQYERLYESLARRKTRARTSDGLCAAS